jgi:anti-sigma B factor antagonist
MSDVEAGIRMQILRLRGELTSDDAHRINNLLSEYVKASLVHVILNLENVTHMQAAGLPVLQRRAKALRDCGGDLKLVGLSPYLKHLVDLAGYYSQFDVCDSEEEAGCRFFKVGAAA